MVATQNRSMPNSTVPSRPLVFERLPEPAGAQPRCSPPMQRRLDLLLLALEALELGGSERMLTTVRTLALDGIVRNRVALWRMRCTNPWRRSYARRLLSLDEARALVAIASYRARDLTVVIRQLALAQQVLSDQGQSLEQHFRLADYLQRFRAHFRSRMNPRRTQVARYTQSQQVADDLALSLLNQLLFCTGTAGTQRLWFSLFDGEIP
jgi:hypothetical protein